MNLKRAVLYGVLAWILIFFEVSLLMFGFKLEKGVNYYFLHFLLSGILILAVSYLYFKKEEKGGLNQGIYLGIVFVLVGVILDAIITVPLFVKNYNFFVDRYLILGYCIGILITTIYGYCKKSCKKEVKNKKFYYKKKK